jgi:hypothetical protein
VRAYGIQGFNLKIIIYREDQIKNENVYYFIEKTYDFEEDKEEVQTQLKKSNLNPNSFKDINRNEKNGRRIDQF